MISTGLTRARRFQAALALDPIPASKVQSAPLQFAELDKHNRSLAVRVGFEPTEPVKVQRFSRPPFSVFGYPV